jgi:flavin-dependent dehydrogenase
MAKRQQSQDTKERTKSGRRYSTGGGQSSGADSHSEAAGRGTARPHEEGMEGGIYAGEDLNEASLEDLREFADELQIEDYESLTRAELVREIRNQTQARP